MKPAPMQLALDSTLTLNNGAEIPRLGLGVYQSAPGDETLRAVYSALEVGYRHIDTASVYGNEADVGAAVAASGLAREDLFITTKLWNQDHGLKSTLRACRESLERLDLEYVDLYLIHWPVPDARQESYQALELLYEEGLCRAIGVSNYTIAHLEELLAGASTVPAVNQVEYHPYLHQRDLKDFCALQQIALEAYSPLVRAQRFDDERLKNVARKYGKSPAQILIRWSLEQGNIVIPKSVHPERIRENADVFDFALDEDDQARLNGLHENLRTCWDPTNV